MFDFIRSQFKVGDAITLICTNGSFSGLIAFISSDSIILKTSDGKMCGVKGSDISFFESFIPTPTDTFESLTTNIKHQVDTSKSLDVRAEENTKEKNIDIKEEDKHNEKAQTVDNTAPSTVVISDSIYKPGEKIPLDTLAKIDPSVFKKNRLKDKTKKKMEILGCGLESLSTLVQDKHNEDNKKNVPPRGYIVNYFSDRAFGFIKDSKTNKNIYFSRGQIIDPTLTSTILPYTPVDYSLSENHMGEIAICIHRPMKVYELLELSNELLKMDNCKQALEVVKHILEEYPDNFDATSLESNIKKMMPSYQQKSVVYSNAYSKAKKYHGEKNFEKAIEYYLKAIKRREKLESAIKDLGMLYGSLYKAEQDIEKKEKYRNIAIDFIQQNVHDLADSSSTYNFLESFYYTIRDFVNFLPVIDKLLEEEDAVVDKKRMVILLSKKAAALIQMNEHEKALDVIDECLEIDPKNLNAPKLRAAILEGQMPDDIESLVSATSFDMLTSGISPFIEQTLDNYNEYFGVPQKIIQTGEFNEVTLREIRKLIDTAGKARARERAKYLLTEGKLMIEIEPSNEARLRSVMARYCNAMALNHISDNSSPDITRFYYNEAFSLEESYEKTANQVSLYLLTHCYKYNELLNSTTKTPSVDESLNRITSGEFDSKCWESILAMFLYNREISAQITAKLFSDNSLKQKALIALSHFGCNTINVNTKEDFISEWNAARDIRLRDYKKLVAEIRSMGDCDNVEELSMQLYNLRQCQPEWMCTLDVRRINIILNNIAPAVDSYVRSSGYRNKQTNYNNSQGQVQQLIDDITIVEGPTKISYEALLPLLEKIQALLKISFEEVVKMSEPKIDIKLESSDTVVDSSNLVTIQVSVSNDKDSSPISEVSVSVDSSSDVQYISENNISYNAIEGGEYKIFKLKVRVSDFVIRSRATAIDAKCKYKTGNVIKEVKALLSLKLYSPDDFKLIDNPYSPMADGGPVPIESKMFFGREEFISNIVKSIIESPSKQVIIYGQKRCGKSSVLLHLKKRLLDTGKTFCIFFSLGDIIQNLSESAFYHKILSSIKDELESLEFNGLNVPNFNVPNISDFKSEDAENPLNTFTNYMVKFKRACKSTSGWEDKNLVVMIDEFTYLYTEIKKGSISSSIMKQWKAVTQNERAQFSVVLVGQDVVPSFKKEDYARNAFGVIQDIRLTYLQELPARDLIEKPILDENCTTRYIGNAVNRIIEYTSRNPYYIQIFCARLVDYMNSNKSITVTEADVNDVAKSFVVGDQALEEDKFDNLIRAGETEDLQEYPESEIIKVLREIAVGSKNIGYCSRNSIDILEDKERENDILKHLVDREVLEKKGDNNYKIQVKLFQEWLLNH